MLSDPRDLEGALAFDDAIVLDDDKETQPSGPRGRYRSKKHFDNSQQYN